MREPSDAQSPLGTIPSANQAVLSMQLQPLRTYLYLRGQTQQNAFVEAVQSVVGAAPPVVANTWADAKPARLLWLAPNEWLLSGPGAAQDAFVPKLRRAFGNLFAAVTDVSDDYAAIEVVGPDARHLLARGCTANLHPCVFGTGCCVQTLLAGADVVIAQTDETPRFEIIARRSAAGHLWSWLDAGARDVRAGAQLNR